METSAGIWYYRDMSNNTGSITYVRLLSASILALAASFLVPASVLAAPSYAPAAKAKASSTSFAIPVPFTSQAPLGEWKDERQQDGCEEASTAMAMAWIGGEKNITKANWKLRILILSNFENKKYGEYRDVALKDVVSWLFNDYFHYDKAAVKAVASSSDILAELEKGHVVMIPANGQALKNPNFTAPGPERHMLLVKGYDYKTKEFITNDSGTRRGENYRYPQKVVFEAIRPYKTGNKLPFPKLDRQMIVVWK